jgi:hypothetical protein
MSILEGFLTETEFVAKLRERTGKGSIRQTREWRRKRRIPFARGPNGKIFFPENALVIVLEAALQQPVRSRRAA